MKEYSDEEKRWVRTVNENANLLTRTNREKIEYTEEVKYHAKSCPVGRLDGNSPCGCPTKPEKKSHFVNRPSLLKQLQDYSANRDADLEPKAARGAPRVKKAKLNPELNGFLTLDEITCDAYASLDRIFTAGDRDRRWLVENITYILQNLGSQTCYLIETGHPGLAKEVADLTDKWVRMAQNTLRQHVRDRMFDSTLCGNCGVGALSAPGTVNAGSVVRCLGTPATPPCGHEYPATEWLALYERGRHA